MIYPLSTILETTFVPSAYNKDFDATGNDIPVPDTVLNVNVYLLDDLFVPSSTTYTLSTESGTVTVLLAARVPVSFKYRFLPFDTAPLEIANAMLDDATSIEM